MIEQIDLQITYVLQQSKRIRKSIHSGTNLAEATQLVERNKHVITAIAKPFNRIISIPR